MDELQEALSCAEVALALVESAQVLEGVELDEVHRLLSELTLHLRSMKGKPGKVD